MGGDQPQSRRERNKARTRAAVRHSALRLFTERGYTDTTVGQIADAAGVSAQTFFHYFAGKRHVLLDEDMTDAIIEGFISAPPTLTPVAAYRHGLKTAYRSLTDSERDTAMQIRNVIATTADARAVLYTSYARLLDSIAAALATRRDAPSDPAERRVLAGAIVGVIIACSEATSQPDREILRGLSTLDEHLRRDPPRTRRRTTSGVTRG